MSETGASLNDKIDLAPWGYAPGSHPVSCSDCIKECSDPADSLHFLHRHATRCVHHALAARQTDIRIYEMDDPLVDPEEIVAEMIVEAFDDSCARVLFIGGIFAAIVGIASLFYWL